MLPWVAASAGADPTTPVPFEPDVVVAEAYRAIRTSILLSRAGEPPRTILFTSATRGEGKTVSLLNTGIMFAQLGPPVLVVDAGGCKFQRTARYRRYRRLAVREERGNFRTCRCFAGHGQLVVFRL